MSQLVWVPFYYGSGNNENGGDDDDDDIIIIIIIMIVSNDQGSFLFALKKPDCVAETNVNGFYYFFLNK